MSIFKNLTRILLSGAVLFCLWGCADDIITHRTEVYEYKIPMGGDSVLAYKATSYYEIKGEDNCSFMGCSDPGYHRRLSVTIDYCVESGGVQKSCVKGIPYFTNTDQPLVSTYEKGVYILDFVSDANAIGGVKYLQKIWNWETGGYSEDTLVQREDLLSISLENDVNLGGVRLKLLTVAQTDSGYFLRLSGLESNYEGQSYYMNTNRFQKAIQNAKMDTIIVASKYGNQRMPKCQLGQWSHLAKKYCFEYNAEYKGFFTSNQDTLMTCKSIVERSFMRTYKDLNEYRRLVRYPTYVDGAYRGEEFDNQANCEDKK